MYDFTKDEPLVYFIVLNYCSYEDTIQCMKTIKNISYPNYKLLIIDNNSLDGSGKKLSQQIPKEEFIQLPKNTGYAGGNNYAIKMAIKSGADYVFIVNPDIRFLPDSITDYINIMEKNPKIGALNPVQIGAFDGGSIDKRFKESVLNFLAEKKIVDNLGKNLLLEVKTLFGASLLISSHAIKKAGGFDPLYFAYGEEKDLCRRLKYHGFKLAVTFKFPVVHLRTYEDDQRVDLFREYLRFRAGYIYELKNPNRDFYRNLKFFYYRIRDDLYSSKLDRIFIIKMYFYMKLIIWLSINLLKIKKNINFDKIGFSHIDL